MEPRLQAGRGLPRACWWTAGAPASAKIPPKKKKGGKKRGKRSKERTEARIERGSRRRLERVQAEAERRYPEFLAPGSSRRDRGNQTRLVVIEEPVRLREGPATREAAVQPFPPLPPRRRRPRVQLRSVVPERPASSSVRLRSADPQRKKVNRFHLNLKDALLDGCRKRRDWKSLRFYQRLAWRTAWRKRLPRGTVGQRIDREIPANCSTCDEEKKLNRPKAATFAKTRLKRKFNQTEADRAGVYEGKKPQVQRTRTSRPSESKIQSLATYKAPQAELEETEEESPVVDRDPSDSVDYGGGSDDEPDKGGSASFNIAAAQQAAC